MGHRRQVDYRAAGRGTGADDATRLLRFRILVILALPVFFILRQGTAPTVRAAATGRSIQRGGSACAACHQEAKSQPSTSMAHALERVEECRTLSAYPLLKFKTEKYLYRIERRGDQSIYSVSDGIQTVTMPIRWAMGASSAIGQTYILEKDGELYESRVSYFREINGLDITLGARGIEPSNALEAAGRHMDLEDERQCFGCHATGAIQGQQVTLEKMIPGVQCEHCHGSTERHLAAMTEGGPEPGFMKDLSKLSTEEVSSFCGQCHRTWEVVVALGRLDINDIRFQPYRLTSSMCYDDDPRISCLACHNPHREVSKRAQDYDARCQACHSGGKPKARRCGVATNGCTSCHMPKIELPGAHHKFTDHRIRIVKANAPFPG